MEDMSVLLTGTFASNIILMKLTINNEEKNCLPCVTEEKLNVKSLH